MLTSKPASRQRKTKRPCQTCFLHHDLCICEFIPKLNLKTKISLIVHYKELKRTTNTGRLAASALMNSEVRIRGQNSRTMQPRALDLSDLLRADYESFLLFPSDSAVELSPSFIKQFQKPIQLIVPDGNWRQASKVHYRHHELKALQRVKVMPKVTSKTQPLKFMRKESVVGGMATLEAIAQALGIIEGVEVENLLGSLYQLKLERTLKGRGIT